MKAIEPESEIAMSQPTSQDAALDARARKLPWAFGAGLVLIGLGYALAFVSLRNTGAPRPAVAEQPVEVIKGSVPAGFALETFATEAEATRADQALSQSGLLSQQQRLQNTTAQQGGAVEVSLMWDSTTDVDLSVQEPGGGLVAPDSPSSLAGKIDVDANPTNLTFTGALKEHLESIVGLDNMVQFPDSQFDGRVVKVESAARPQSLYSKHPIEHIFYDKPPAGTYKILVRCYGWREPTRTPLPVIIEVRSHQRLIARLHGNVGPDCYIESRLGYTTVASMEIR